MKRRTFLKACGVVGLGISAGEGHGEPPPPFELRIAGRRNRDRSEALARKGMVCTSQTLATNAGLDILKAGGNAVDAAICANVVLGLVEPMGCGPGGDLFAIVWIERDKKLYGLNASGRSAHAFTLEEAQRRGLTSIPGNSPLSWSVPGCVGGWQALLERFGTKHFAELAAPAIAHATEGFPVSPVIARDWSFLQPSTPTLAETFYPSGRSPRTGEIFSNPRMATFLESLARGGLRSFYEGEPAEKIVAFAQAEGGLLELRDFREHTADWVEPVSTNYRGFDVWEIPPNGQGVAALQMLNMLENFDVGAMKQGSGEFLHLFIEAKRLAYEDRAVYYADPARAKVPLGELLSKEYAKERAGKIDLTRAATNVGPGDLDGSKDTIYLTTSDSEGNMVSLIQSLRVGWGSGIAPGGLGFCIQDRGVSFSLDPNHRNKLEGNKRPFHTIIPSFVTREEKPVLSFGVMGGGYQPQGHAYVLTGMIDFGLSPQQAGDQARVEHSGSSEPTGTKADGVGSIRCEEGITEEAKAQLAALGHVVKSGGTFGGYQGILRMDAPLRYAGASDARKDGCAMGY